jgi:hypothetical protein
MIIAFLKPSYCSKFVKKLIDISKAAYKSAHEMSIL